MAKRHSTFTEAMEIARSMQARFTVLTHFSQRYSKVVDICRMYIHNTLCTMCIHMSIFRHLGPYAK